MMGNEHMPQSVTDSDYMAARIQILERILIDLMHEILTPEDMEDYVRRISFLIPPNPANTDVFSKATEQFIQAVDQYRPKPR